MNERDARAKHDCPACGAEATWNPAQQALVCAYCGAVAPATVEKTAAGEEVIREHDLVIALRQVPDAQRGWQTQKTSVRCRSCQAISVFDPERVGQRCDFCGSSALVPYEEIKESIRPESLLPMKVSESQVRDRIRQWYSTRWFAPNRLKRGAWTDTVKGLYVPYWTFDAEAHADWTAESGYYYYVTESYRDAQGQMKTRPVRKIRWQSSSGSVDHRFDDELVAGSRGVQHELLRCVEPFPTKELVAYDPSYLRGWVVERYQIDLATAARTSREAMEQTMRGLCDSRVPGDTHRNLQVRSAYSGLTFKHILVPLWLLTYKFGAKIFHVVVNGYTATIAGEYPKSWVKILLAVLAALAVIGTVVWLARG